jgi:hypothetical protein
MQLRQNDLRSLCKDVFSKFGVVTEESPNVYSVTIKGKKFLVAICDSVNIAPEALKDLGLGNHLLISGVRHEASANYWSVSELLDYYVEKMYINEKGLPQVFSRGQ